ncbi:hypothetical protein KFK09_022874 [Dendrobium nobile]|uniref:Uncharacterized protein n=1 Tax=Dendrobium nobile TaxID=94219 RepID=A0A8T3AKI3_DENNO|nr:hypothetical protein KFK09_022874 [Dendrobium nobile]
MHDRLRPPPATVPPRHYASSCTVLAAEILPSLSSKCGRHSLTRALVMLPGHSFRGRRKAGFFMFVQGKYAADTGKERLGASSASRANV